MLTRLVPLALTLLLAAAPTPARACMAVVQRQTNLELVEKTPVIVVARAVELVGGVVFRIERVLKGDALRVGDKFTDAGGSVVTQLTRSSRYDFSRPQPAAFDGSCRATGYRLDQHYLLFLSTGPKGLEIGGQAFSRVNEEVDERDEPWTSAVEAYVRITALADRKARRRELERLMAEGAADDAGPKAHAIAADAEDHLATPTWQKSFEELLDIWERYGATTGVLAEIARRPDPAVRTFMRGRLAALRAGKLPPDEMHASGVATYLSAQHDAEAAVTALELYRTWTGSGRAQLLWGIANALPPTQGPLVERVLAASSIEEADALAPWLTRHPSPRFRSLLSKLVAGAYAAHPPSSQALAATGDGAALAWATARLPETDEDAVRRLAITMIALSPRGDVLAGKIIAAGVDADLAVLLYAYANAHHPRVDARVSQLERMQLGMDAKRALQYVKMRRK